MFVDRRARLQVWVLAMGAGLRRRDVHHLVKVGGLGPLPRGMAHRRAAFFGSGLRACGRRGRGVPAAFELAAMQGLELGLQLLVGQFHLLAPPLLLVQLAPAFLQLPFIVALQESLVLALLL
jgi:hypothetical protein